MPDSSSSVKRTKPSAQSRRQSEETGISLLDILRILVLLLIGFLGVSYWSTAGESLFFGKRPWFTRPDLLKQYLRGEINLTPDELSRYDGSNPDLPVYLAINGTIFDVSAGRQTYGPGGSYHHFAGRDATRGYVTGCFAQDRTSDLRGVEEMFLPIDDPNDEREKLLTSGEKKVRREKDRRDAKRRVKQEVDRWEKFYANSDKYFKVGKVVGQNPFIGEPPELCPEAKKARPTRKAKARDEL